MQQPPAGLDLSLMAGLALGREALDRAAGRRGDEAWVEQAWQDPGSAVLLVRDGTAPVRRTHEGAALVLLDPASAAAHLQGGHAEAAVAPDPLTAGHAGRPGEDRQPRRILLGIDDRQRACFSLEATGDAGPPQGSRWLGLREVGADLDDRDAGLLTMSVALDNWHRAHPCCARCGRPTVTGQAGWLRRCPQDGSEHYPRTDPAVIVLVRDAEDRALLGRQRRWPAGWFSTLAGFVEPGESAEAAVRREVLEEAGVRVGAVAYLGSQPWPFPSSLMLGYHAWADSVEVEVDGEEIAEAAWFSRTGLAEACAAGTVRLPPRVSIARRLVERWYGSTLPGDWSRPAAPGR